MAGGDDEISFFSVIYNHLLKLIVLSYSREKVTMHSEAIWSMLQPYIDESLEKKWKEKRKMKNEYKAMLWRVRLVMLALYEIETLPNPNASEKERVFSDYDPQYKGEASVIANELEFQDLMMRYYFLLTDLVSEGMDVSSMNYMADVGYYLCSPYITWEDVERWKQATDMKEWGGKWGWFTKKIGVISSILDREGKQFSRRVIDQVGATEGTSSETMINPDIPEEEGHIPGEIVIDEED